MTDASDRTPSSAHVPLFGLRIGVWYATLFVVASVVIVVLTYWLTSTSLAQRDEQVLRAGVGAVVDPGRVDSVQGVDEHHDIVVMRRLGEVRSLRPSQRFLPDEALQRVPALRRNRLGNDRLLSPNYGGKSNGRECERDTTHEIPQSAR